MTPDYPGRTDSELVTAALAGEDRAFVELVHRHRDAVYRLIRSYVADGHEALDLTQESFIAVHRALGRYDPERSFRAWLSRIAINKCRDWANRRRVRRFFTFARPIEEAIQIGDDAIWTDKALADRQELERVEGCIARLPRSLREPLILFAIDGLTQAEVAEALSVSEKAVELRVYRARRRLEEMLGKGEG